MTYSTNTCYVCGSPCNKDGAISASGRHPLSCAKCFPMICLHEGKVRSMKHDGGEWNNSRIPSLDQLKRKLGFLGSSSPKPMPARAPQSKSPSDRPTAELEFFAKPQDGYCVCGILVNSGLCIYHRK
jgi:hypothetical protein